jgi:hypothetical protein
MEDAHALVRERESIGDGTRAVGRRVVHDENLRRRHDPPNLTNESLEILRFVVGRDEDQRSHGFLEDSGDCLGFGGIGKRESSPTKKGPPTRAGGPIRS